MISNQDGSRIKILTKDLEHPIFHSLLSPRVIIITKTPQSFGKNLHQIDRFTSYIK